MLHAALAAAAPASASKRGRYHGAVGDAADASPSSDERTARMHGGASSHVVRTLGLNQLLLHMLEAENDTSLRDVCHEFWSAVSLCATHKTLVEGVRVLDPQHAQFADTYRADCQACMKHTMMDNEGRTCSALDWRLTQADDLLVRSQQLKGMEFIRDRWRAFATVVIAPPRTAAVETPDSHLSAVRRNFAASVRLTPNTQHVALARTSVEKLMSEARNWRAYSALVFDYVRPAVMRDTRSRDHDAYFDFMREYSVAAISRSGASHACIKVWCFQHRFAGHMLPLNDAHHAEGTPSGYLECRICPLRAPPPRKQKSRDSGQSADMYRDFGRSAACVNPDTAINWSNE